MEVKFNKKTATEWEFTVKNEETILSPLKKKLSEDSTISFVSYAKSHPQLKSVNFIIKGKNLKASFTKAIKDLKSDLNSLAKAF